MQPYKLLKPGIVLLAVSSILNCCEKDWIGKLYFSIPYMLITTLAFAFILYENIFPNKAEDAYEHEDFFRLMGYCSFLGLSISIIISLLICGRSWETMGSIMFAMSFILFLNRSKIYEENGY